MDDMTNSAREKRSMRLKVRAGLTALVASAFVLVPASLFGQGQPATGKAAAAPAVAAPKQTAAERAKREEIVATVNADKITRGQLIQLLGQYNIPDGTQKTAYTTGLDILINTKLLTQFLTENRVKVEQAEIDKIVDEQRRAAAEGGTSLEKALADSNYTIEQVREQIANTLQWGKFIENAATDKALDEYMKANPDLFNGTIVKASHIQINADESASDADKQKAKEKLLQIKKDILAGKITFADAANKYSEDPVNKEQPSGGDLKWFKRDRFMESFGATAFKLKKNEISDPVETAYGIHLIQVTDRRDGKLPTLEQIKERVKNQYAVERQNAIVAEMRKKAKIDIKPMPADFFGPPTAPPATTYPKAKADPAAPAATDPKAKASAAPAAAKP
jgi:peptidyl-prolyl cis-trans isomerase C